MATDISIPISPDLTIAAQRYGDPLTAKWRVLASHGWMDNCGTYVLLGPALAAEGAVVCCIDLPGHGRSGWRPPSSYYITAEYAANIMEVADALGWDRFVYIGHSMSGGLGTVLAASFPHRVTALCLIDNLGLSVRPTEEAVDTFARAVAAKRNLQANEGSSYPSLVAAVDARLATVARHPGTQSLSREGATALVQRGSRTLPTGEVRFTHDRRIAAPSLMYASEDTTRAFLSRVTCPVLCFRGLTGWPVPQELLAARIAAVGDRLELHLLPGSHHLHLDPDTAPALIRILLAWLHKQLPTEPAAEVPAVSGGASGSKL